MLCRSTNVRIAALSSIALTAAGFSVASPGLAKQEGAPVAGTIKEAMAKQGPMITDAERATIRAKCGERDDGPDSISLNSRDGVLICENGRKIDDPEVRAIVARVGERARAHVAAVMSSPEVKRAISGETAARATEVVARAREQLATLDVEAIAARATAAATAASRVSASVRVSERERAEIKAALDEARAQVARIDGDAVLREADTDLRRTAERLRRESARD